MSVVKSIASRLFKAMVKAVKEEVTDMVKDSPKEAKKTFLGLLYLFCSEVAMYAAINNGIISNESGDLNFIAKEVWGEIKRATGFVWSMAKNPITWVVVLAVGAGLACFAPFSPFVGGAVAAVGGVGVTVTCINLSK